MGPEEQLCRDEIDPALLRALKAIPENFLTPLLLREVHEASYDEIAQILSIPKGTVMSRLSRARGLLRKSLTAPTDTSAAQVNDTVANGCMIESIENLSGDAGKKWGLSNELRRCIAPDWSNAGWAK